MRTACLARFSVVVVFVAVLAGCITTTPGQQGGGGDTTAAFVGAQVCSTCHQSSYAAWTSTLHSQAMATLAAIGQSTNANCVPCHAVGVGQDTGFVSMADTPGLGSVQCENCHGAGGNHIKNPEQVAMAVPLEAEVCGSCHQGFHHPNYEQWSTSAHAAARETVASRPDSCLECHSAEAILATGQNVVNALQQETIVAKNGITCVVCHSPHGSPNEAQLRTPPSELCLGCHTSDNPAPTASPHHPQREIILGIGGFEPTGDTALGPNSDHSTSANARCVTCHVYKVPNETPSVENPVNTGHTFLPEIPDACLQCHTDATELETQLDELQTEIQARIDALKPYFTAGGEQYIDPATLGADQLLLYNVARFNTRVADADASQGVHNSDYVERLLSIAESIFADLALSA
jgi:predicted CXXCH cytochrome family protein